jgi:hypothetical protein
MSSAANFNDVCPYSPYIAQPAKDSVLSARRASYP